MKDEKLLRFLHDLSALDPHRQITDEEIDEFLASNPEGSFGRDEKAWPRVVGTVLRNLHPDPIRGVSKNTTLGDILKKARKAGNFSREAMAAAIGENSKDVEFIERIENNTLPLSSIAPSVAADVASLLRIHIIALEQMLPKYLYLPPKSNSKLASFINEDPMRLNDEDANWLEAVRRELQIRGENDLLY